MPVAMLLSMLLMAEQPATPPAPPPQLHPASVNPRANELFDREPDLKSWALRVHDRNHDGWLTLYEAQVAAESFREIADGDHNGRVSISEYAAALDFIRARY